MSTAEMIDTIVVEETNERKRAEDHLRLVIDTIPTMAWSLRPDGTVDFVNQRWLDYTGLTRKDALEDPKRVVHPEDLPRAVEKWLSNMPSGNPHEDELRLRRADGEFRWFLIRVVPLRDEHGRIVNWYGTSTDIEDRMRAAEELQALSRRLVDLQESDRKDLARELHDRIGQNLTALNINLAIMRQALSDNDAAIRSRLDDSAALLKSTAMAIENVVTDLRPPMLDDHGLKPALDWYARDFAARAGISVKIHAGGPDERAAAEVEIALFRIAQEALNNVAKHAHASSILIALNCQGTEYVMSVRDDGLGWDAEDKQVQPPHAGFGMVTMRERAQAVGGHFQIESLAGGGTQITVRIPK